MKRSKLYPLILIHFILALGACTPVSRAMGISVLPATTASQVSPPQATVRPAQVQSVEIQVVQTDPLQMNVIVRGYLYESCSTVGSIQTNYTDATFQIKLDTVTPPVLDCVRVNSPYKQSIPLAVANLEPGTYTVIANGISTVFTIPGVPTPSPSNLQLVVRASDSSLQIVPLDLPRNINTRPAFNSFLPLGGSAAGNAYVLDSEHLNAIVTDGKQFHDLIFVQSPTPYGLAVWPGDANTSPRLAWATQNLGGDSSSTIKISNPDGTQFNTLLTQDALNPPTQLMVEFFSADGQWLYFSKEPVGLGGYILFSGASNLYKINITTKVVKEVIPQGSASGPQACLDAISTDYRYVTDHCAQNTISIRDLTSGGTTTIQPPADLIGYRLVGSARFNLDGSRVAYALGKGDQNAEQGWVAVSDGLSGGSKLILTSQTGSYYAVAGWLDDQTLLVQSTSPQSCSPNCKSELWTIKADGTNAQKVADGSFLAAIPNDAFIQLPADPTTTPAPAVCLDAAEYLGDDGLDGTTYTPNTAFTKTWTVKNIGSCTWDSQYLVYQVSGELMTQQPGYWLVPQGRIVAPGQSVDVSLGMTSPPNNGIYRSNWGLKNADGEVISITGSTQDNTFFVEMQVSDETDQGKVTASAIDISLEQGSGEACTANATYFIHASITTDGPATVPYEIASSAGQISAGYFVDEDGQSPYITGELVFHEAVTKQINLRFVGPYPYPQDITVMLRVDNGEWYNTKLYCP